MDIEAMFEAMRRAPRHIKHPIDDASTLTKPYADIGPLEGSGAGTRQRITIGFAQTFGARPFEGVRLDNDGRAISFTVVGGWELGEIGEVLRKLGDALTADAKSIKQ